jgi:transcriptional regulator with XRE-family HTH domain
MDSFLTKLGTRLRSERERLGISQTAVARSADRSKQLVSASERSRAEMTASAIAKVSRALNMDPRWLLFGDDWKCAEPLKTLSSSQSLEGHDRDSTDVRDECKKLVELRRENQRLRFAVCDLVLRKLSVNC